MKRKVPNSDGKNRLQKPVKILRESMEHTVYQKTKPVMKKGAAMSQRNYLKAGKKTTGQKNSTLIRSKGSRSSLISSSMGSLDQLSASSGSLQKLPDEQSASINVVVRVRPLNSKETKSHDRNVVTFPGNGQILLDGLNTIIGGNGPKMKLFSFNVVFEPAATQEDVFNFSSIKKLVRMAMEGFNATCFCYGQTGSGKTHTLTGPPKLISKKKAGIDQSSKDHGLVFRAFLDLFHLVKEEKKINYVIKASFLEIYNEKVIDLLNPGSSRKPLSVRWSKKSRSFFVENLFTVDCEELNDLQGVLEEGMKNRSLGSHNMNKCSGRSHTILTVHITSEHQMADSGVFITKQGKINFVDLAGSEMTKKTKSSGKTLEEANNINKSLMVLGYCIASLSDPKRKSGHIPYRDSKLTKLLSDSLAGSGITLMIACVSPALSNVSETLNTLRYAARAKKIRTKPIVVMDPRESLIVSLKREVEALQNENEHLRVALDLSRKHAADVEKLSGSRERLIKTPPHIDLEKIAQMDGSELVDLIKHYAIENEALRKENADLFNSRDILIRDHEIVCRENERLLKKLEDVNSACVRSPIITSRSNYTDEKIRHDSGMDFSSNESSNNSADSNLYRSNSNKNGLVMNSEKKTHNVLPDSIQKEMDKKGIGKTITNFMETLKNRKSANKRSGEYSKKQNALSTRSQSHASKSEDYNSDDIFKDQDLIDINDVFGSPLGSANGYTMDTKTHPFDDSFLLDDSAKIDYHERNGTYTITNMVPLKSKQNGSKQKDLSKLPNIYKRVQIK